jgi:hypothetical protein
VVDQGRGARRLRLARDQEAVRAELQVTLRPIVAAHRHAEEVRVEIASPCIVGYAERDVVDGDGLESALRRGRRDGARRAGGSRHPEREQLDELPARDASPLELAQHVVGDLLHGRTVLPQ